MKKLICTLFVSLLSVSAYSQSMNTDDISQCSGHFDNSFKELNLTFYYTSPKIGGAMLLRLDEGDEIQASYSIVAVQAMNFNTTAYELAFRNGFSLGEVRFIKNTITNKYEFLIYNGNSKKVIELNCI